MARKKPGEGVCISLLIGCPICLMARVSARVSAREEKRRAQAAQSLKQAKESLTGSSSVRWWQIAYKGPFPSSSSLRIFFFIHLHLREVVPTPVPNLPSIVSGERAGTRTARCRTMLVECVFVVGSAGAIILCSGRQPSGKTGIGAVHFRSVPTAVISTGEMEMGSGIPTRIAESVRSLCVCNGGKEASNCAVITGSISTLRR
ncbi:uncharacterized protein BO66DRAFT_205084 [Aspergillus aculeatinus CBS 121060]|uniref:Uncharacterized protein n=1 Tax=Aspergillus aculeatinus CBS 121060 TaxID=1448322 RepID=A0ACD1HJK3_9EURO|nr:hypothetical protein BO66DRAFT_205084 [Aspergillus aculeatinus CBS 121060]RAH73740.1 hypothetical protein BO66DRAFT_205084 [Aspergillus aculeatinus CBS 121060]